MTATPIVSKRRQDSSEATGQQGNQIANGELTGVNHRQTGREILCGSFDSH
jgi:hypothetical protein